jgi:hypothetical protein
MYPHRHAEHASFLPKVLDTVWSWIGKNCDRTNQTHSNKKSGRELGGLSYGVAMVPGCSQSDHQTVYVFFKLGHFGLCLAFAARPWDLLWKLSQRRTEGLLDNTCTTRGHTRTMHRRWKLQSVCTVSACLFLQGMCDPFSTCNLYTTLYIGSGGSWTTMCVWYGRARFGTSIICITCWIFKNNQKHVTPCFMTSLHECMLLVVPSLLNLGLSMRASKMKKATRSKPRRGESVEVQKILTWVNRTKLP